MPALRGACTRARPACAPTFPHAPPAHKSRIGRTQWGMPNWPRCWHVRRRRQPQQRCGRGSSSTTTTTTTSSRWGLAWCWARSAGGRCRECACPSALSRKRRRGHQPNRCACFAAPAQTRGLNSALLWMPSLNSVPGQ